MSSLTLIDLNYLLYHCNEEERVEGCGGVYNVPGYGDLVYAGIQGFMSVLDKIRRDIEMGHPLCQNLYQGVWMVQYTVQRLKIRSSTKAFGEKLEEIFLPFTDLPNYMRPKIFDDVLCKVYKSCMKKIDDLIPLFKTGDRFTRHLILTSVQLLSNMKDAGVKPYPHSSQPVSMAAGLPHFSHGFMRCWGRDTFIALPGLLITTGRLDEARDLIVGFGRTFRHGLIPNLLSEWGINPRYNCRDAVWWWARAVQLLWKVMPGILEEKVHLLFNGDESTVNTHNHDHCTVLDIIHTLLQRHVQGISFTERGAGHTLDEHLKYEGFKIEAGIDQKTGFVYGGSRHNCGTWMDKVGSSDKAQNRGLPSTPRYGSSVELVGLCYQTVKWCSELRGAVQGVTFPNGEYLLYSDWCDRIKANFEDKFWIEEGHYYRDCVNDRLPELRPNQCVAMVVAPEMFNKDNKRSAIRTIGRKLCGPLGMSTLSPDDPQYRPYYENSNDSEDYNIAHGFNYHQGPEWLWCMGYFLRAQLEALSNDCPVDPLVNVKMNGITLGEYFSLVTAPHRKLILDGHFRGLTELTNKQGERCNGSCPTQAWSSGCMLEFLSDIRKLNVL